MERPKDATINDLAQIEEEEAKELSYLLLEVL
jgi:hypothetical protein